MHARPQYIQQPVRLAYAIALLVGVLLFGVGCQNATEQSLEVAPESVAVQPGDIARVVEGGIEIAGDEGRIRLLPIEEAATRVHEIQWNTDESLVWVQEHIGAKQDETYYTIELFEIATREQTTLYLSRAEPYSLSFSAKTAYIAFLEDDDLYTVDTATGSVQRIVEAVDRGTYAWSPEFAAVLVRLADTTVYIEVEDGVAASKVQVYGAALDGLAFVNATTALGVEQDGETARLIQIDLRTTAAEVAHEWQYEYSFLQEQEEDADESQETGEVITDEMRMHRFRIVPSPYNEKIFAVQEQVLVGDEEPNVYVYTAKEQRVPLGSNMRLVGWLADKQVALHDIEKERIVERHIDTRKTIDLYDAEEVFSVLTPFIQ